MRFSSLLFSCFISFLAVIPSQAFTPLKSSPESVVIMTFNVENLFDTKHDNGKEDHTYLPIEKKQTKAHRDFCNKIKSRHYRRECLYLDWSEKKLSEKMSRIARTILQVNSGQGPDILILEEIENKNILERLRTEYLQPARYQASVFIRGEDPRGINVAMLSRLPEVAEPRLYNLPLETKTRGILRSDFRLPTGDTLTVFGVHFPSPSHPETWRIQAFDTLLNLRRELPADRYVVAGGDFNVSSFEDRQVHHFENQSSDWLVSHQVGCKGCVGTEFFRFKKSWSFLDVLMFSKNLDPSHKEKWALDPESIQVIKGEPIQLMADGTPARFKDLENPIGVSDHLPLAAQIVYTGQ